MIKELEFWRTEDEHGITMPWYTRQVCAILDQMDLKDKRVWEYGGGQSTIWYRSRGAIVFGVDSNPEWAKMASLELQTEERKYLETINQYGLFDLVCIDGIWRDECFAFAVEHMETNGMIVIDNWKQESAGFNEWPETESYINDFGLKIEVYKEPGHIDWATAIIRR